MVTGQLKTGEIVGGEITWARWMEWCVRRRAFGLDGLVISFPFGYGCSRCFSFPTVTPTLFVLLASVFALVSTRYRYPSIRSSVFRFDFPAVLFFPRVLLRSVYCAERVGPLSSSTYTDSFPFLPSVLSFYPLVPDRRATAYRTYVFSSEV